MFDAKDGGEAGTERTVEIEQIPQQDQQQQVADSNQQQIIQEQRDQNMVLNLLKYHHRGVREIDSKSDRDRQKERQR